MSRILVGVSRLSPILILTLVFVILRLCNIVVWPWWLVLIPLWGVPAVVALVAVPFSLVLGLYWIGSYGEDD